ncbi:hypothetical protein TNCT_400381 [Trichonephila clavata]|uniref:Uncharacterized protein n=1 Tax=Trichonephila clavata TaxID=2740835 RepID=A0A8X6FHM9_TRICU|nr:hypothetical protein TNCT_400381 [Trichonephila clavata]
MGGVRPCTDLHGAYLNIQVPRPSSPPPPPPQTYSAPRSLTALFTDRTHDRCHSSHSPPPSSPDVRFHTEYKTSW